MNRIELVNNDVYFMETMEDIILINNNYSGLIFFNSNLEQIGKVEIIENLSIYSSYIHKKKILLFCPDNNCLVYFDFNLNEKKIILLRNFDGWIFSPLYIWCRDNVLLTDYRGHFVNVDLNNEKINLINIEDIVHQGMRADIKKLKEHQIYKIFERKKKAFVYFQNSKVRLIDYNQDIKVINEFEKENYYDFDWADGYTAKIGEKKIEIIYDNNKFTYNAEKDYIFSRGKIVNFDGKTYMYILSALKSNNMKGKIEKMGLNCND